ncbi:regulator of polyketide synthase expression [Mycobacteroides abscessus]|nr:regulator of polyketide synthase expression [Mycobacteroides abscessus]
MPDNPATAPRGFRAARKPRERAEVPEALLHRIKQYSGRLSTEAVHVMEDRLPFFTDLEASQRASVALVVQTAINNFVEWIRDPEGTVGFTMQAFEVVPQDLAKRIALRHSVDMVRTAMEFFEEVLPLLARNDEQLVTLTEGILRYSRDLAFGAASAYAEAAETRGAWDSRLEATVVDAVVRGDTGPDMLSRAAALNWDTNAPATVIVGTPRPEIIATATTLVHEVAQRHGRVDVRHRPDQLRQGQGGLRRGSVDVSTHAGWIARAAPITLGAARVMLGVLWLHEGIFKYSAHFGRADILLIAHSAQTNTRVPQYFTVFSDNVLGAWPGLFGVAVPLLEVALGAVLVLGLLPQPAAIISLLTLLTYWSSDQLISQYPVMAGLSALIIAFPAPSGHYSILRLRRASATANVVRDGR